MMRQPLFGVVVIVGVVLFIGLVALAFWGWGCHMSLMESLILAQDERWRRA